MKQKYDEYFSSEGDAIAEHLDGQASESEDSEQELSPNRLAEMSAKMHQ